MQRLSPIYKAICAISLGFILCLGVRPAAAQDQNSAKITSPTAGGQLSGLFVIQGTAANPNMRQYFLEFDAQTDSVEQWFPIAPPVTQQVTNGVLGQWNTTAVPDGVYQIRLRVVLKDGSVISDVVQNLHVNNKQPTGLPTSVPSITPIQSTLPPTAGPSPTPIIQQPPTSVSRSTPLPTDQPVVVAPTPIPSNPQSVLDFDAIQSAFCGGAYFAIGGFVLYGIYSLIQAWRHRQ